MVNLEVMVKPGQLDTCQCLTGWSTLTCDTWQHMTGWSMLTCDTWQHMTGWSTLTCADVVLTSARLQPLEVRRLSGGFSDDWRFFRRLAIFRRVFRRLRFGLYRPPFAAKLGILRFWDLPDTSTGSVFREKVSRVSFRR